MFLLALPGQMMGDANQGSSDGFGMGRSAMEASVSLGVQDSDYSYIYI